MENYKPIASKSFGIDEETGLEKILNVFRIDNNAKLEIIEIHYDIALIYPTGKLHILETNAYSRYNGFENPKFNQLRDSQLGQGITQLIKDDINQIKSFETINQDLSQLIISPVIEENN